MKTFLRFRVCESFICLGNKSISRGFSSSSSADVGKTGPTGNLGKGAGGRSDVASRYNQKTRQQKIQDRQPRIANLDEFKSALTRRDRVAAWLKFTDIAVDHHERLVRQITRTDYINLLGLLAHHQISSWRLVLDTMKNKSGIMLDKEIYELYLDNLCKLSLFKEATEVLSEMRLGTIQPSLSTYNIILNMYAKKSLKDMMAFLELMKRSFNNGENSDISIDVSTHNIVLKAFVKNGEFENALNYWNTVSSTCNHVANSQEGDGAAIKANAHTLSILMRVADGLNDIALLSSLYKKAQDHDLLDKFIYSGLLSIYSRRNMLEEFKSVSSALQSDQKVTLDLPLYTVLIKHTLAHDSAYDAFLLLKEMKEKAIYPDIPLIQAVTDGLVKTGLVVEAFEFVEECRDQGYLVTHLIYRTVLGGLVGDGDIDRVAVVYERIMALSATNAVPTVLFNLVLECASNSLSVDFFQKVWKDLERGGRGGNRGGALQGGYRKDKSFATQSAVPNVISYEIALGFYMKIRKVDAAIDILTTLLASAPPSPSSTSASPISSKLAIDLIRLAIQSHEYEQAAYIVSLLAKYGGCSVEKVLDGPDGHAYHAGFCRLIEELWRQVKDEHPNLNDSSRLPEKTPSLRDKERNCLLVLDVYKYLLLPLYPTLKPSDNVYIAVMGAFTVVKDLIGVVRTWSLVEREYNEKGAPVSAELLDMLLKAAVELGSRKTAVALLKMVLDQDVVEKQRVQRKKYLVSPDGYESFLVLAAKFTDGRGIPSLLLDLEKNRQLDGRVWRLINCAFQERKLQCGHDKLALKETLDAMAYVDGFIEEFYPEMIELDPVINYD